LLSKHSRMERFWMSVFHFIRNNPKVTEFGELNDSQKMDYFVLWYFLGVIIGIYASSLIVLFLLFRVLISEENLIWTSLGFIYLVFSILTSLGMIVLGIHYIDNLIKKINQFTKDVIDPITKYHQSNFPYVKIKTDSGEFKGQLKDIKNNSLSFLSDRNALTVLPWDTVKMMEACYQNECTVFDNDFINEK